VEPSPSHIFFRADAARNLAAAGGVKKVRVCLRLTRGEQRKRWDANHPLMFLFCSKGVHRVAAASYRRRVIVGWRRWLTAVCGAREGAVVDNMRRGVLSGVASTSNMAGLFHRKLGCASSRSANGTASRMTFLFKCSAFLSICTFLFSGGDKHLLITAWHKTRRSAACHCNANSINMNIRTSTQLDCAAAC